LLEQGVTAECSGCGKAFTFRAGDAPVAEAPSAVSPPVPPQPVPSAVSTAQDDPAFTGEPEPGIEVAPLVGPPAPRARAGDRAMPAMSVAGEAWVERPSFWRGAWVVTVLVLVAGGGALWHWRADAADLMPHYAAAVQRLIG